MRTSFVLCLALCSFCCEPKKGTPQEVQGARDEFNVEFLFQVDSVRVYRFWDGGERHFFTSKGTTINPKTRMAGKVAVHFDEVIAGQ